MREKWVKNPARGAPLPALSPAEPGGARRIQACGNGTTSKLAAPGSGAGPPSTSRSAGTSTSETVPPGPSESASPRRASQPRLRLHRSLAVVGLGLPSPARSRAVTRLSVRPRVPSGDILSAGSGGTPSVPKCSRGRLDGVRFCDGPPTGPRRAGPRRDKPGHGVTVATSGNVTRGRDHRPPARVLPPGPLPNRCPLFGVCTCARALGRGVRPSGPDPAVSQIGGADL